MKPTVGSLFAGIGGFDLGLERAGLSCRWQVEFDPQARRVLERHWPATKRLEDVRECGKRNLAQVDVICGGFPCQDLSIAGGRKGLAGARSGLFFEMMRIIDELRPSVCIFENVPGLLSNDRGRSAVMVLWEFAKLRFHGGWRVLDSQFFGVAQRRDRVFGVFACGRTGARRAAEILALAQGSGRHSAASGQAGKEVAATIRGRSHSPGVSAPGRGGEDDQNLLIASTLTAGMRKGVSNNDGKKGAPRNLIVGHTLNGKTGKQFDYESEDFVVASSITASAGHHGHSSPRGDGSDNLVCFEPRIGRNGRGQPSGLCPVLKGSQAGETSDMRPCILTPEAGVRRLMPVECLRLQAFPDDWLDLDPPLSDSAKYRLVGNAVTVNVAEWIGRRVIEAMREET